MIRSHDGSNEDTELIAPGSGVVPTSPVAESCGAPSSGIRPGDFLDDRYLVESFVARGGMGEVYRARDTELGVPIALKTIRADVVSGPQALRRFKQEILLARSVSHPNVCRMFDLGRHRDESRNVLFLTMEFLPGETLASRIRSRGRISGEDGLPIVRQLADALDSAHRAGIVHRDFKSSNVMLVPSASGERVVITDFGLARATQIPVAVDTDPMEHSNRPGVAEADAPGSASLGPAPGAFDSTQPLVAFDPTRSGLTHVDSVSPSLVGTPVYMAPEQVRGGRVGPAADLYSLGVVLFEMATGTVPFHGLTPMETAQAKLTQDPPRPGSLAEVEEAWEEVILRLLAREPGQRFPCARDAVDALEGKPGATAIPRHSLPAERDAFVGRNLELEELARRLEGGPELLTILGAGGTGKTRLARRYGWNSLERWPGGVWFCNLAEARSVEGIAHAVATTLDVPLSKSDPIVQLGHAIAGRGRALIVLDNFEQVSEHAEATLGRWVARSRETSFLVTSRQRLQLEGETTLDLDPLDPEKEGVELFVQRAQRQRSDFELTEVNRAIVAEIVRLVDGLPLAIELAAARLRTLSFEQLRARLGDRLSLLAGSARGRHATLRATLDWSWELLYAWEQAAVAQAAVFEGGFTLEAAEAVLDLAPWPAAPSALDVVQALVDKCWFRAGVVLGAPRFEMLSSSREYAAEKLGSEGAIAGKSGKDSVRRFEQRHGEFFARFGTPDALGALDRHGGVARRNALGVELDNIVSACRRAVERGDGEIAVDALVAAWEVFQLRGPFAAAIELGQATLSIPGLESDARARALRALGSASRFVGRMDDAHRAYEEALSIHRESGDRRGEGVLLSDLGVLHREQGRTEDAHRLYDEALAIYLALGERQLECFVLANLGTVLMDRGRMDDARRHFEDALAIGREFGNRRLEGAVLGSLGALHLHQGQMEDARGFFEEAFDIHRELGNRHFEGIVLGLLGVLHQDHGRMEDARHVYEEALAIHREVGNRQHEGVVLGNLGNLHLLQGRMEDARRLFEEAIAIHRERRDRLSEGIVLGNLAILCQQQGRMEAARRCYEEALVIHRAIGNRESEGIALANLGYLHMNQNRMEDARLYYEEALTIHREVGSRHGVGSVLDSLGTLHMCQGRLDEARCRYEEALATRQEIGDLRGEGGVLGNLGELEARRMHFAEARLAFARGEALLRKVDDRLRLAGLLCSRGECERLAGEFAAARAALAEAESLAEAVGAGPDSELGRKLTALREHLAEGAEGFGARQN